jgi:hypothetical protein
MNLHGPSMPTRALVGFLLLSTAPTFADTVLFNSGPINGTISGEFINLSFEIADSFSLPSNGTLTGVKVGLDLPGPSNTPIQLDWAIWNAAGPGGGGSILDSAVGATLSNTFLFTSTLGGFGTTEVYQSSFSLPSITLSAGTYWLELQNAVDSASNGVAWDLNNGPSTVWASPPPGIVTAGAPDNCGDTGSPIIPGLATCGSAFEITGETVPEPRGLALFVVGCLLAGAVLSRKLAI